MQGDLREQIRSLDWEDPIKKEMANNSSIFAWEILWAKEPGELQSMGSPRVWQDWAYMHKQEMAQKLSSRIIWRFIDLHFY